MLEKHSVNLCPNLLHTEPIAGRIFIHFNGTFITKRILVNIPEDPKDKSEAIFHGVKNRTFSFVLS